MGEPGIDDPQLVQQPIPLCVCKFCDLPILARAHARPHADGITDVPIYAGSYFALEDEQASSPPLQRYRAPGALVPPFFAPIKFDPRALRQFPPAPRAFCTPTPTTGRRRTCPSRRICMTP